MIKSIRTMKIASWTLGTLMFMALATTGAKANDIAGNWTTPSGGKVKISPCGSSFCSVVTAGEFKGRQIGKLKKNGAKFTGTITDPKDNKTYKGSAKLQGNSLNMTGCAYKIFCKTQTWKRQ